MRVSVFAALTILASLPACISQPESSSTKLQSKNNPIIFNGICDGSAAVRLDDETILVANDELNTLFAYDVNGGPPVASIDLTAMLNLENAGEMDLEAAAVSAQQIWWLGSHSLDSKGAIAPNRQVFFASNIPSVNLNNLKLLTQPVDLIAALMESEELAMVLTTASRKKLPKQGGINLEGLAAAGDGFLVGFRSPLKGSNGASGEAIVARIARHEENFAVQQVYFLDLADRGIRDIVKSGNGYIVVAGPVVSGGDFALYTWDGISRPQQLMKLNNLNAEGIVDLTDYWLLLSDDGKVQRADDTAGDGYRKCDRIQSKNGPGVSHPGIFFRAEKISKKN